MTREKLRDRRPSVTQHVDHVLAGGRTISPLVTFSFDERRKVREIFTADFKAGSDNQTLIVDASILVSRLLQHGATPRELAASLSEPPSVIGSILRAAATVEEDQ